MAKPASESISKWQPRLIYVVNFLNFIAMSLFSPLINKQVGTFNLSPLTIGIMGSIFGAAQLLTTPIIGQGSEIYGANQMFTIAMIATGIGNFVQILTISPIVLVAVRASAGLWRHTTALGKSVLVELVDRKEIPYAVGNYITSGHLGVIIGPILGGYLIHCQNGSYIICIAASGIYLSSFAIMKMLPNSTPKNRTENKSETVSYSGKVSIILGITDRGAFAKLFLTFCICFANQTIRAGFPLILIGKYAASVSAISYLNSIQSLTSVLVGFTVRPIIHGSYNGNFRQVLIHAGSFHVLSFIGQVLAPNFYIAGLSILLLEASSAFLWVALVGITLQSSENVKSILMAKEMVGNFALLVGPTFAGAAQNTRILSYNGAPSLGACASLMAVLCTIFLIPGKLKAKAA